MSIEGYSIQPSILPKWSRVKFLGSGSYGCVYLAVFENSNNCLKYFAVKTTRFELSSSLQKELRIFNVLKNCPEIISCFGQQLSTKDGAIFYNLFLEYAPAGTLSDLIHKSSSGVLQETNIRIYTHIILKGLSHIHSKGYIHCDLIPNNIIVFPSNENSIGFTLKIVDFGLSKKPREYLSIYTNDKSRYFRGTLIFMSPKSVTHSEFEAPLDIWSLGCTMLKMYMGKVTVAFRKQFSASLGYTCWESWNTKGHVEWWERFLAKMLCKETLGKVVNANIVKSSICKWIS